MSEFPKVATHQCDDGLWIVWCDYCDRQIGAERESLSSAELLAATHDGYHIEEGPTLAALHPQEGNDD